MVMTANVRDERIDCLKAIAIFAVPLAHYLGVFLEPPGMVATIVHIILGVVSHVILPVFLFFSGWFHRDTTWPTFLSKSAWALLKPYFITAFVATGLLLAFGHPDLAVHKLLGILAVNGNEAGDPAVRWLRWAGPIWFLPMLFWCRIIHKAFYNRLPGYLIFATTVPWLALVSGHWIPNYTFGLLPALCCICFYSLGAYCHEKNLFEKLSAFFASGFWVPALLLCGYSMTHFVLDHSTFRFSPYPVLLVASLFTIVFMYRMVSYMPRFLMPLLNWLGRNTLLILCYHTLAFVLCDELHRQFPSLVSREFYCVINFVLTYGLTIIHVCVKKRTSRAS